MTPSRHTIGASKSVATKDAKQISPSASPQSQVNEHVVPADTFFGSSKFLSGGTFNANSAASTEKISSPLHCIDQVPFVGLE